MNRAPAQDVLLFLDFEASGLSGWPIEIGLAWIDRRGPAPTFWTTDFLIRPEPDWDKAEWDPLAEEIHGISVGQLHGSGTPAPDVARTVAGLVGGCCLVSDAADFDGPLLARLFEAMAEPVPEHRLVDVAALLRRLGPEASQRFDAAIHATPPPHRAGPDALRLARAWHAASRATGRQSGA